MFPGYKQQIIKLTNRKDPYFMYLLNKHNSIFNKTKLTNEVDDVITSLYMYLEYTRQKDYCDDL